MKLKITVRQSAPKVPEAITSTTRSNKRKWQEFEELHEKPSRPMKSRRNAKLLKGNAESSKLEALPSEIQHMVYTNLFHSIEDKDQTPRSRSTSTTSQGPSKESSKLSCMTSILSVSKKTNLEATQAFYDTTTRPVSRPIIRYEHNV
jgi:hypothetical protein